MSQDHPTFIPLKEHDTPDVVLLLRTVASRVAIYPSGCWLWTGAKNSRKYGHMSINGKHVKVHRLVHSLCIGSLPDAYLVCHYCDNPPCCNPDHLFLGTQRDNMRDAASKGRVNPPPQVGEKNLNTHLTEDDIRLIRQLAAEGKQKKLPRWQKDLAFRFGISEKGIYRIVTGKVWGHVT